MLIATREHDPRASGHHFGEPPRSVVSRFTGGVQLLGSLIGIPLALAGGYSTWHANFSPEAKCQALRANIIAMLDRKADASTLRLLVQRDVTAFQRDCVEVDAEAVAAFKTLLTAERTTPPRPKAEVAVAHPAQPVKAEPVAKVVGKPETPKKIQAVAPPAPKREPEKAVEPARPIEIAKPEVKPESEAKLESKPVEVAVAPAETERADTAWVASVREALRESALRPPESDAAPQLTAPIAVPVQPALARDPSAAVANRFAPPRPPADIPAPAPQKIERPVPPAAIPNADAAPPAAD